MCDERQTKGDEAPCVNGHKHIEEWLHEERDKNKNPEGSESSMSNDAAARWPDLKTGATAAQRIYMPHFQCEKEHSQVFFPQNKGRGKNT